MSLQEDLRKLAECFHPAPIRQNEIVHRCPHCGSMQIGDGPWARPHLVEEVVRAWKKEHEAAP